MVGETSREKASSVVRGLSQAIAEQAEKLLQDADNKLNEYYVKTPNKENKELLAEKTLELWPQYFNDLRNNLWRIRNAIEEISLIINKTEL